MTGSVFGLGASLDTSASSLSLMTLVAFTVLWEIMTHRIEVHLKNSVYLNMVNKIYKELAILGFVSFSVMLFIESGTCLAT